MIVILTDNDVINITLEGKQSKKAEMLIDLLYEDNDFLYEIARHFQDEQRYTVALLHDILTKVTLEQLATMGFREHYLRSIDVLNRSDLDISSYINKLIDNNDTTAIDIALLLLENEDVDKKILEEKRNNNDRY